MKLRDLDLQDLQGARGTAHSELMNGLRNLKKEFPEYFDKIGHFDAEAFEKLMGEYLFISMSKIPQGPIRDSIQQAENYCRELKPKLDSMEFIDMIEHALHDYYNGKIMPVLQNDLCLFSCTQALKLLREYSLEFESLSEDFVKKLFTGDCVFNFAPALKLQSLDLLKRHNFLDEGSTVLDRVITSHFPIGVHFALEELERLDRLDQDNINNVLDSTTDLTLLVAKLMEEEEIDALEATSNMRAKF